MISNSNLEESVREAASALRACQVDVRHAQEKLGEAEREFRLLVELAELRGLELGGARLAQDGAPAGGSGSSHDRSEAVSVGSTAVSAVIDILGERGEPVQIQDLLAAVKARGVPIPGSGRQANLIAHISRDDRIARPRRGYYALTDWEPADARPTGGKRGAVERRVRS